MTKEDQEHVYMPVTEECLNDSHRKKVSPYEFKKANKSRKQCKQEIKKQDEEEALFSIILNSKIKDYNIPWLC